MPDRPAPSATKRPRTRNTPVRERRPLMLEEDAATGLLVYTGPIPDAVRDIPVGDLLYDDDEDGR